MFLTGWGRSVLSSRKLMFDLRALSFGAGSALRAAEALDCPDLVSGCSGAARPPWLVVTGTEEACFF